MYNKKEKLFSELPTVYNEEWMEKITDDLKGAALERRTDR